MIQLKELSKPNELWQLVENTDGKYAVSNLGRVASFYRPNTIILKPHPGRNGYLKIVLYFDGKEVTAMIHRLVGLHFVANPESKAELNHIDGDKNNNYDSNLEWCTRGENCRHAVKSGLHRGFGKGHQVTNRPCGHAVHTSVLTEDQVTAIRADRTNGLKQREIAEKHDIKMSTVRSALFYWKHI